MPTIQFTIETRHLADGDGRPVPTNDPEAVTFHSVTADSIDDAVRLFVRDHQAELIGSVLRFPGFQAVATVRTHSGVYTLQFTPTSQEVPKH